MSKIEKKIKIAYVIPRFHPFKGGAERNIYALAERMAKNGHKVTAITTNVKFRNEELPYRENVEGIDIIRNWALNEALYAGFYPSLLPTLLRLNADVIHASGIGFIWREFCFILKKIVSPKTVFVNTPHGRFMTLGDTKGFRGFARRSYTLVLRLILPWLYDKYIAVNEQQAEWMTKEYGIKRDKIFLVPNGIDKEYIEKKIYEPKLKEKTIITFLGRIERYKGIQDVIEAIAKLMRQEEFRGKRETGHAPLEDFEFWVLGRQGRYVEYLQELIKKRGVENFVKFIFSPSDEERDEILYKSSHIHILPSRWEATGIVLIEAMAKGNAIITTEENEAASLLITEGENGYVYKAGDFDKLAEILRTLIENPEEKNKMIRNNLEKSKKFTWESAFELYDDHLASILN